MLEVVLSDCDDGSLDEATRDMADVIDLRTITRDSALSARIVAPKPLEPGPILGPVGKEVRPHA